MHVWRFDDVPKLPGVGERVSLRDSVTRQPVLAPQAGLARMYACGITPYDATHLGHAFTYVSIDTLHRAWLDAGLDVHYAQNVTDVDDPLLERALDTCVDWEELAASQVALYRRDMAALRVLPPTTFRGVVESLPDVVTFTEKLIAQGSVYQIEGEFPDWYFAVESAPHFLAGRNLNHELEIFAERGGDPDRKGKRHPLDPLVWRAQRVGEPSWNLSSMLGMGRPGWHVECTAIALEALGTHFDVQAGGKDLAFPHHQMCAIQAECATSEPFAKAYLHVGMVGFQGEKMSKSKGNLVFVSELLTRGVPAMAIRLLLLGHHYREDWEYTDQEMANARIRLEQWQLALLSATSSAGSSEVIRQGSEVVAEIRARLADDLDTPAALTCIDEWAKNPTDSDSALLVARVIDFLLGIRLDVSGG